jgi:hypothetical protein
MRAQQFVVSENTVFEEYHPKAVSLCDDLRMNGLDGKFHDGFLDGVLIREAQVIILVRTIGNEEYALVADDVTRLRADGLLQGNIIFDIVVRRGEELTRRDVDVYGFAANSDGEKRASDTLEQLRADNRLALEINPSYGASAF